jgi:hypothetical protein
MSIGSSRSTFFEYAITEFLCPVFDPLARYFYHYRLQKGSGSQGNGAAEPAEKRR